MTKPDHWHLCSVRIPWNECWTNLLRSDCPPDAIWQCRRYYRRMYMRTERWKEIRHLKLFEANGKCQRCGTSSDTHKLDVHHLTYERLGGERLADLQVLCYQCHGKAHYRPRKA